MAHKHESDQPPTCDLIAQAFREKHGRDYDRQDVEKVPTVISPDFGQSNGGQGVWGWGA